MSLQFQESDSTQRPAIARSSTLANMVGVCHISDEKVCRRVASATSKVQRIIPPIQTARVVTCSRWVLLDAVDSMYFRKPLSGSLRKYRKGLFEGRSLCKIAATFPSILCKRAFSHVFCSNAFKTVLIWLPGAIGMLELKGVANQTRLRKLRPLNANSITPPA